MSKENEYAIKLNEQIAEMFRGDGMCDNAINSADFQDGNNLKAFLHALSNILPTKIYNTLTGHSKNILEFNHIANQLCFEYANKEDDSDEDLEDDED